MKKSTKFRDVNVICSYEVPSGKQVDVYSDELIKDLKEMNCEIVEIKIFRDEKPHCDKLRLALKVVK